MDKFKLIKTLSFTLILTMACLNATATVVTAEMALNRVKAARESNEGVVFSYALVNQIETDSLACDLTNLPSDSWLHNNSQKWFIFADERPNQRWAHPCKYYYLPANVVDTTQINLTEINGNFPPSCFEDMSVFIETDSLNVPPMRAYYQYIPGVDSLDLSTNVGMFNPDKTFVLILGGGFKKENNHFSMRNDCAYFYNTMRYKYGIPKYNITTLFGSGGDNGVDVFHFKYEDRYFYLSLDFDNDGYSDVNGPCTKARILEQLGTYFQNDSIDRPFYGNDCNLVIFVASHGGYNYNSDESFIRTWKGDYNIDSYLYSSELKQALDTITGKNQFIMLGVCNSGQFTTGLANPGRVIVTACQSDEYSSCTRDYNIFLHQWTNAINGMKCNNDTVNVDLDGNGYVSMFEAWAYAKQNNFEHIENDDDSIAVRNFLLEHPQYASYPDWLGKDLAFDHVTDSVTLYIRDNMADIGTEFNNTTTKHWDSPDIWLSNDSVDVTELQHQILAPQDTVAYIFTNITNRGYKTYNGDGKYLQLFYTLPTLGASAQTLLSQRIDSIPISVTIQPDSSIIIPYRWVLPTELREYLATHQNQSGINLLASIVNYWDYYGWTLDYHLDSDSVTIIMHFKNYPPEYENFESIRKHNSLAMKNHYIIDLTQSNQQTKLYLANPDSVQQQIGFTLRTQSPNKLLFEIISKMSPTLHQIWNDGGSLTTNTTRFVADTTQFYLNGDNASFTGFTLQPNQTDSLELTFNFRADVLVDMYDKTLDFDLIAVNTATGDTIGANTYTLTGPLRPNIEPGIEPGTDDPICPPDPGGEEEGPMGILRATNILEPVDYQWLDAEHNLLGTNPELELTPAYQGSITLRVTAQADQAVAYASTTVQPTQMIAGVSPNPFSDTFTITLSRTAPVNTSLILTAVTTQVPALTIPFPTGSKTLTVNASQLPQGIYIATLQIDNQTVASEQVVKQ